MLSVFCAAAVAVLAVLALTRKRVVVICGFYCFYALLTILGDYAVPRLGPLTIYRALYVILAISLIALFVQDHNFIARARRWPLWPFGAMLIMLFASCLYSINTGVFSSDTDVNLWNHLVLMALFVISACHVQRENDLAIFATTTVAVAVVLSVWVIWNAAQLNFEAYRAGISIDQNYVSWFVLAGVLTLLNLLIAGKGRRKFWCIPVMVFLLFASLLLASRGVFGAFVIAALYVVMSNLRGYRKSRVLGVGVLLLLVVVIALLLPGGQALVARFNQVDLANLNMRTPIWSISIAYFADSGPLRMLFGSGMDSVLIVIGPHIHDMTNYHNDYLRYLLDQGIVGLFILLAFLYSIGQRVARSNHPLKHLMMGWFLLLLITGLTETITDGHVLWMVWGVIASASSLAGNSSEPHAIVINNTPPLLSPSSILEGS